MYVIVTCRVHGSSSKTPPDLFTSVIWTKSDRHFFCAKLRMIKRLLSNLLREREVIKQLTHGTCTFRSNNFEVLRRKLREDKTCRFVNAEGRL